MRTSKEFTLKAACLLIPGLLLANVAQAGPRAHRKPASARARASLVRETHSKELLGKKLPKAVLQAHEKKIDPNAYIHESVKRWLPVSSKKDAEKISQTLIEEAYKYGFDPLFLVAVVKTESAFRINARGTSGEVGLMQLMPTTGEWMSKRIGIQWKGEKTLLNPVLNIRLGAAYLSYLRTEFDSYGQLYIAAYNMGAGNVNRALIRNVWPKDYASRVIHHYKRVYAELGKHSS